MSALSRYLSFVLFLMGSVPVHADSFHDARTLFDRNNLEEALPLFEEAALQKGGLAEVNAYLAETYRRLGMREKAVRAAEEALEIEPCHAFAHTVIAETCRLGTEVPRSASDTTWTHLLEAVRCDSSDGNAWLSLWGDAIFHDRWLLMEISVRMMDETGFFTAAALHFARWMLRTLPPNSILVTNGDMDTYPLLAVQAADGFRSDVTVVERGLLGTTHFIKYLKEQHHLPIPMSNPEIESLLSSSQAEENYFLVADEIFKRWLALRKRGKLTRPIALAVTLDPAMYKGREDHLEYAGPFYLWHEKPVDKENDPAALRASLAAIEPRDFAGPWTSETDRSPVRRVTTYRLAGNVSYSALVLAEELIDAGNRGEASRVLDWVKTFENETELGPIFDDQVAELRGRIAEPAGRSEDPHRSPAERKR